MKLLTLLSLVLVQAGGAIAFAPARSRLVLGRAHVPRMTAAGTEKTATEATAAKDHVMFCFQCEQTQFGTRCTTEGICGKTLDVAALQDLLLYRLKGLAGWAVHAHDAANITDVDVSHFYRAALFSTMTNVNFDPVCFYAYILDCGWHIEELKKKVAAKGVPPLVAPHVPWFGGDVPHPFEWELGAQFGIDARRKLMVGAAGSEGAAAAETLLGLHELVTYARRGPRLIASTCSLPTPTHCIEGSAGYAHHAALGGRSDEALNYQLIRKLAFICTPESNDAGAALAMAPEVGKTNLGTFRLGRKRKKEKIINQPPTPLPIPSQALLDQTKGTGINVYTHGEMLPAHGYPELRKYPHLAGHYGGAGYWQAVVVLLSLLHLGVKNIRLGPALPAFLTPEAVKILVDTYGLKPADLKDMEHDIEMMLSQAD
ncbi:Prismane-like protein [Pavlovales sp. CCMP2436]|nr:Prismane-like protein [Pavlovales sp. CCMP2436]